MLRRRRYMLRTIRVRSDKPLTLNALPVGMTSAIMEASKSIRALMAPISVGAPCWATSIWVWRLSD